MAGQGGDVKGPCISEVKHQRKEKRREERKEKKTQ
jgi:hypothetical protein